MGIPGEHTVFRLHKVPLERFDWVSWVWLAAKFWFCMLLVNWYRTSLICPSIYNTGQNPWDNSHLLLPSPHDNVDFPRSLRPRLKSIALWMFQHCPEGRRARKKQWKESMYSCYKDRSMCSEFCCFHKVYQCPKVLFCFGSSVFIVGGNGIF